MPTARRIGLWAGAVAAVVIAVLAVAALRGGEPSAPRPHAIDARRPDTRSTEAPREAPGEPPAPGGAAADADKASHLVESARGEASAGRYNEALALLMQAYDLDPRPATLLELAAVYHRMGRCREARGAALRAVAASSGAEPQHEAQQLLAAIGRCD